MSYKPKIVAFLCNWCSYTGADLAGTSRMKYAPNIRIIRVMCSGRVEPTFVLKSFREGADGVMILGCHPGDCHYHEGNYKCLRRYHLLKKFLLQMGLEEERLRLEWISASEGKQFAELVDEFTSQITALGPCKVKETVETIL
ncbi:MAG TPA: hydrogenase iron-sulfur subunit [Bacteroidia bacterium]|nr:hydrogenase iron-sulfur subunit [Bacteroidia bacterium]HRS60019.1 hydrogenase iron-sulfur subunit [Bacteroidia bacterium]HRU69304.1 hydrogenase iron-sulfur subunit [Bacteroidia bacterium]